MADIKISTMDDGGIILDTDQIPVVRGGSNYRVQVGSAAGLDGGIGVGDLLLIDEVDGNPALPAIDGSQLTNVKPDMINMVMNASALTLSAIPTGLSFAGGTPRCVNNFDLSKFTQIRMNLMLGSVAGPAGSKMIAKYKAGSFSGVAGDWSDIGFSEVSISLSQTPNNYYDTGWINLADLAKTDVFFGLFTSGGNGSSSPVVHNVNFQFL